MTIDHDHPGAARLAGMAPAIGATGNTGAIGAMRATRTVAAAGAAHGALRRQWPIRRRAAPAPLSAPLPAAPLPATPLLVALLLAALLSGCGTPLLPRPDTIRLPKPPAEAPPPATLILPDETAPLLAYHQQVRRMTQGELLQELAALGMRQPSPRVALQMGMVLLWTRGAGDLVRAQAQFDTVASTAHPLAPLAALLSAQCQEQRRLAEHGDRQQAQLKESQRKIDQLTETLESLKAIERNLPARGNTNERQR